MRMIHVSESKLRIVAHLANFAYDPFNYELFRKVCIFYKISFCEVCTKRKKTEIYV